MSALPAPKARPLELDLQLVLMTVSLHVIKAAPLLQWLGLNARPAPVAKLQMGCCAGIATRANSRHEQVVVNVRIARLASIPVKQVARSAKIAPKRNLRTDKRELLRARSAPWAR